MFGPFGLDSRKPPQSIISGIIALPVCMGRSPTAHAFTDIVMASMSIVMTAYADADNTIFSPIRCRLPACA